MSYDRISRERKHEMFDLYIDGATHAEIGAKYGISKQRVEQILHPNKGGKAKRVIDCVYPGLKKWMEERNMSASKLYCVVLGKKSGNCSVLKKKLAGKSKFSIRDIESILEYSGCTYEQLFSKANENEEK